MKFLKKIILSVPVMLALVVIIALVFNCARLGN